MMKKAMVLLMSLLLVVIGIPDVSAESTLPDGAYAVNLKLMHAEKDQESMGNRYVGQRGLLKVSGNSYQIYIVPADGYDNQFDQVDFKYYQDGSTQGNVLNTQQTQNVVIDGVTHAKAVTFTMPNRSGTCGLQFKVPIMGMTVSARLVVNLSNATPVEEPTTAASNTPAPQTADKQKPGNQTPSAQETRWTQAETKSDPAGERESVSESVAISEALSESAAEVETDAEESTTGDPEMVHEDGGSSTVWAIVGIVAAAIVIGGVVALVVVKKKRG